MPLSLYEITIPPFIKGLKTLSFILQKASQTATTSDATESLLSARLVSDMAALPFQIQRVSDTAKGLAVRLGRASPVSMPDTETTFAELQTRIAKTIAVLEKLDPHCMDNMEEAEVLLTLSGGERKFTGHNYAQMYALPNFYFHLCMAYAILRKEGVALGKMDFLMASERE